VVEKGETAKARMKLGELVRLLERNGFTLVREQGSIRYYEQTRVEQTQSR
jgi:predicted RNA binding protein YcfA (HicA-like mRNA interferase family)